MHTTVLSLLTIIAEAVLKERLIAELMQAGATGYTVWDVEGDGSRRLRSGDMPGENIHLETITSFEVADKLLEKLAHNYFPHYAMIAYTADVHVVRGDKYV
jgi:nitrogen regulatory protein P-II 2